MAPTLELAFILIVLGLLFLVAEVFLATGGILFGLAIAALVLGVFMTFQASEDPTVGLATMTGVLIGAPILAAMVIRLARRTRFGTRLVLRAPSDDATLAAMPVNLELENLRGKFGRALSHLRPSGVADFNGKRVDVVAEGDMVQPGEMVRCLDIRAGIVVVRRTDPLDLGTLEKDTLG